MTSISWLGTVVLATVVAACATSADETSGVGQADLATPSASAIPLFGASSVLAARIEAPLQDLFDKIPKPVANEFAPGGFDVPDVSKLEVAGKISYEDPRSGHKEIPVTIALRGNTSLFELAFPKLSLKLDPAASKGTLFEHAHKIKLGTHGGESDKLTPLGRRANQDSPHREAFVYAMLETLGLPTLKARPALVTYEDTGIHRVAGSAADGTLVRKAFFLEDNDDAATRLGGKDAKELGDDASLDDIDGKYSRADVTRVGLAECLVGNVDWEIDRSIYNVKAIATAAGTKTIFAPYDFDLAGTVTANDANDYPAKFFPGRGAAFHDVAFLLNRFRALGYRKADVDDAVASFASKREAVRALVAGSVLGTSDRTRMQAYVDAFFEATKPASFYLPQTTGPVQVFSDAALTKQIGPPAGTEDDGLGGAYGCGSPLAILGKSPDGKAVHVSFVYDDFHGVADGWMGTEDVVGADGTIPAEVNRCFRPGED